MKHNLYSGIQGVDDPALAEIRTDRGYTYHDVIEVCPDKLPNYEEKIKSFFEVKMMLLLL